MANKLIVDKDGEGCDALVCSLATDPLLMPDNVLGQCSHCWRTIQFRPHAPKRPKKLCFECAIPDMERAAAKGEFEVVMTPRTAAEVAAYMRCKRRH